MNDVLSHILDWFSVAIVELQEADRDKRVRTILTYLEQRIGSLPDGTEGRTRALSFIYGHWIDFWQTKQEWEQVEEVARKALAMDGTSADTWANDSCSLGIALAHLSRFDEAARVHAHAVSHLSERSAHEGDIAMHLMHLAPVLKTVMNQDSVSEVIEVLRKWLTLTGRDDRALDIALRDDHLAEWVEGLAESMMPDSYGNDSAV